MYRWGKIEVYQPTLTALPAPVQPIGQHRQLNIPPQAPAKYSQLLYQQFYARPSKLSAIGAGLGSGDQSLLIKVPKYLTLLPPFLTGHQEPENERSCLLPGPWSLLQMSVLVSVESENSHLLSSCCSTESTPPITCRRLNNEQLRSTLIKHFRPTLRGRFLFVVHPTTLVLRSLSTRTLS